jgi:hypothetical protein
MGGLYERARELLARTADLPPDAPDGFPRVVGGAGADDHRRIDAYLTARMALPYESWIDLDGPTWSSLVEGTPPLIEGTPDELARRTQPLLLRLAVLEARNPRGPGRSAKVRDLHNFLLRPLAKIVGRRLPLTPQEILDLLEWTIRDPHPYPLQERDVVENAARLAPPGGVPPPEVCESLRRLAERLARPSYGSPDRRLIDRIHDVTGTSAPMAVDAGEAWADRAIADIGASPEAERSAWTAFVRIARDADAAKPSPKWLKSTEPLLAAIGNDALAARVLAWFPLVDRPRTQPVEHTSTYSPDPNRMIGDANASILRGIVWACARVPTADVQRALAALAVSAFKKVLSIGPRCVKLGNACLLVLGEIGTREAVGRLAYVKARTKLPQVAKKVDAALSVAASAAGVSVEELEEMSVPDFGLTEVGGATWTLAGCTARIVVRATDDVAVEWTTQDGKRPKSVPAKVKAEAAEELAELKGAVKDVERMLPVLRDRIDQLYLRRKTWPIAVWRERYLDHPLVGVHARRLVWTFTEGGASTSAVFHEGRFVGAEGADVSVSPAAEVALWHPMTSEPAEVSAWRDRLETLGIVQPFKQAHREVYALTDAERATAVYSNRFAAHIIRQHQFHALCAVRGWKNKLRLSVDDYVDAASRDIPAFGLRAEFWVDGVMTRDHGDLLDSGAFVHLATDQVRFYRAGTRPSRAHAAGGGHTAMPDAVPLADVPPLVLSEVMRDVDLFVGVASVGNDPTWRDAGARGAARDYWSRWSFGDLEQSAQTRKAVLEKLVPRLKIADRCTFDDRFLRVRGTRAVYRIHLGSGNVLMEPGDRYLCIVAARGGAAGDVRLPFEGDGAMAIILSKAFLLAADDRITDPTILSQIGRT